jgi:ADP-heptose:LPS heptosyltransferase
VRILLAKRRALGDTVLMSATAQLLGAALPDAEIYSLVPGAFAGVLEGNPAVKKVLTYEQGFFSLMGSLRSLGLDHFIQLHASPSNRWLARLSGAKCVSYSVQNNETEKAYGKHPNALEWDGFFLRTLFGEKIQVPAPSPRIHLSAAELAEGREYWRRQGAEPERVVFLGLGASRPTKRWPPAHFARLAELLRDRHGLIPAIVTGPGETEEKFAALVLDHMRATGLRALGGKGKGDFVHGAGLPVRRLAAALSAVRCYVGNDSGPKHVAVAVGVPTFTFFGPEDPVEWHPYSRAAHPVFFRPGLDCRREDAGRWCGLEECDLRGALRHRCMQEIDPIDVVETLRKELRL